MMARWRDLARRGLVGLIAALGYLSALVVRFLPLVGRRKSVPGARTVRDRVVFRDLGE